MAAFPRKAAVAGLGLDQFIDAEAHTPLASELRRPEVAGGQIQQGQRRNLTRNVQSRQVVVPFRRQGGIDGSARCEHARDLAADDLFGELGILHLFANGDPVALAQQAGEVIVGGVVGHPAHRHRAALYLAL